MTARRFLFLQGPHGPFFAQLAGRLAKAGARSWRVGFNRGDQAFWPDRQSYIAHPGPAADWPARLETLIDAHAITDLVLYGDTRPVHAAAIRIAQPRGLTVHVFEEGYLRPYWLTYERGGSNGHSRLMRLAPSQMRRALGPGATAEPPEAPARWGDLRQHVAWGALYRALVLLANRRYAGFMPHRDLDVAAELRLYLRRLL